MTVKIVVAGDVSVDWYYWPESSDSNKGNQNWTLYEGTDTDPQPGGAVLLAEWLSEILQIKRKEPSPYSLSTQSREDLVIKSTDKELHLNLYLDLFPPFSSGDKKEETEVYRVKNCLGHMAPHNKEQFPGPLRISDDQENADIVIIYDAGYGFRYQENFWPKAIKGNHKPDQKPFVIYNMCPPLFKGKLWNHIIRHCKDKLILILNADDLRKIGINISHSISWEKSATEFLWEMEHKEDLTEIKALKNIITLFNYDGAVYYRGITERSKLYFDPLSLEGDFWDYEKFGYMHATNLMFLSYLSACFISGFKVEKSNPDDGQNNHQDWSNHKTCIERAIKNCLEQGIKKGLTRSREFLINGYGNSKVEKDGKGFASDQDNLCGQKNSSGNDDSSKSPAGYIADTLLPPTEKINNYLDPRKSNPDLWTILGEKAKADNIKISEQCSKIKGGFDSEYIKTGSPYLEKLAFLIVRKGLSHIKDFPVGKFGELTTVDRTEIESFRSIKNILNEYIISEKNEKPLSIAVFGYPGSGKSFGITQVAQSIDSERIEKITFNISQFTSTKDLANAFHKIRDISIKGKIPLAFFDEFDSKLEDEELGWIKYFLVPMQDAEFLDFDGMHPIGRSIFVFAGSMCNNFKDFFEFCSNSNVQNRSRPGTQSKLHPGTTPEAYQGTGSCRKISNKCPDFLSRLRGYVNIFGLNRTDEWDETYIIRRAIQLRSLIERKAPKIIKENQANISCSLLNALINVPEYMHGARSMQAIVEMSVLHEKGSWEEADLPTKNQLELHIRSIDEFYSLLAQK